MKNPATLFSLMLSLSAVSLFAQQVPVAADDTLDVYWFNDTLTLNVLLNDYDPSGNPVSLMSWPGSVGHTDSTISYYFAYDSYHQKQGFAVIKPYMVFCAATGHAAQGTVRINFHNPFCDTLNINNVAALINNVNNLYWDFDGTPCYRVPKNGNNNSLFNVTLWMAGMDINNQLHLSADRYGMNGSDYWSGPVMNQAGYTDHHQDSLWNKVWKLNRTDIEYHRSHYWLSGYVPIKAIATWPGNGNTALGQAPQLAPYHDENNNGVYEPLAGDYPIIRGDQSIFFIFNDDKFLHTESGGAKFGMEVHGMAYAFDCPSDSALNSATFLHYDLYNRSTYTYETTMAALWVDFDLGYAWDDYVGSDVRRNSLFVYNDSVGGTGGYAPYFPAQSVTLLGGSYLDPDGKDNTNIDSLGNPLCDESLIGMNYRDGIVDNERHGMVMSRYLANTTGPLGDPGSPVEYYNYMRGLWKDGTPMQYGGNGHPNSGGTGPECRYMFPDTTDPCDFGTNLIHPPGYITGAGGSGQIWTDYSVNVPYDRRMLGGSGPFTWQPGEKQELDIAMVWARDYTSTDPWASVILMKQYIDQVKFYYERDLTPCGGSFSAIPELPAEETKLHLWPNPANDRLFIKYPGQGRHLTCQVFDIMGNLCLEGKLKDETSLISIGSLKSGIYILRVNDPRRPLNARFIKN